MSCPPLVPISVIPPVSQGVGPLVWRNGNQIARLNPPLNPSLVLYNGSVTTWGDGSAQAPIYLPAVQEIPAIDFDFIFGVNNQSQLGKCNVSVIWSSPQPINSQSVTNYSFQLTDAGSLVTLNNSSNITASVPNSSSVAFEVGQRIDLIGLGTGRVNITGAGGVSIGSSRGFYLRTQYSGATIIYIGSDAWVLVGDLSFT